MLCLWHIRIQVLVGTKVADVGQRLYNHLCYGNMNHISLVPLEPFNPFTNVHLLQGAPQIHCLFSELRTPSSALLKFQTNLQEQMLQSVPVQILYLRQPSVQIHHKLRDFKAVALQCSLIPIENESDHLRRSALLTSTKSFPKKWPALS